jgi:hypothetical protein
MEMPLARIVLAIGLAGGGVLGCGGRIVDNHDNARRTMREVTAEVQGFIPEAMHDNFGAEGFALYDATALLVLEPRELRGRILHVYHQGEAPDSPWRRPGQRLQFRIAESQLAPNTPVFTGGLADVKAL